MNTEVNTQCIHRVWRRMNRTALWTDALRAIVKEWKRFGAILIICALGVAMLLGFTALAEDMLQSADAYYKQEGLYDLSVTAPGGLNQQDLRQLERIRGVSGVAGVVEDNYDATVAGKRKSLTISSLNNQNINRPYVVTGVLPQSSNQIAVNERYLIDSGKHLGDPVSLSELTIRSVNGNSPFLFKDVTYTIVGQVNDPNNVYSSQFATGSMSTQADYAFFVPPSSVMNKGYYSKVYMKLTGTEGVLSYSKAYDTQLDTTRRAIYKSAVPAGSHASSDHSKAGHQQQRSYWIVTDRSYLQSYNQIDTQVSMLRVFGVAFPVLFLLVAVLISLTSMTRMIEEDRQLLGAYSALGYKKSEISFKYLCFACLSSLFGSGLGVILGTICLPKMAFPVLREMYVIPQYMLQFNAVMVFIGLVAFVGSITGITWFSCARQLQECPSMLMRPRDPQAGNTVPLEKMSYIWNHLSFLNKVTARNLFRYKSRALMSIFGIFASTALMMIALTLSNTLLSLPEKQYGGVYGYDAMVTTNSKQEEKATRELTTDKRITAIKPVAVQMVSLTGSTSTDEVVDKAKAQQLTRVPLQLIVVPDGQSLDGYISLQNASGKTPLKLPKSGAIVTTNAARLLGIQVDSEAWVEDSARNQYHVTVMAITENYAGNALYMTQSAYCEITSHRDYPPNAFLLKVRGDSAEKIATAVDLEQNGIYRSVVSNQQLKNDFSEKYAVVNDVVGLLIVMAALLAIVVLFTLSMTNISERKRELATIEVLGFTRREVHSYVNRETLVLTIVGIAAGMTAGWGLTYPIIAMMKMPGIHLEVQTALSDWVIVSILALTFSMLVMLISNRSLDRIDMVESLKSPE
ncbi:ABC transporter permease [Bombiscardovia coagulans]|uniref:FtsX-like permease family n=1 Tax=Bombiscardovia coagulans TaxID=686666 RepID=A0A261ET03_9BIFI|nr:ABC transporter permease [Bombiscardovia coagulans]OZG49994.1 FtsX-like permease family [Bombiscardovia coagulans]